MIRQVEISRAARPHHPEPLLIQLRLHLSQHSKQTKQTAGERGKPADQDKNQNTYSMTVYMQGAKERRNEGTNGGPIDIDQGNGGKKGLETLIRGVDVGLSPFVSIARSLGAPR